MSAVMTRRFWRGRRLGLAVVLLAAIVNPAMAQRKAKPEPPPPLDTSFPATIARCGAAYGTALATKVRATLAADSQRAAQIIAGGAMTGTAAWPGRWLTADPVQKQAKAAALAVAAAKTQERICKEREKRAGRVRCTQWGDAPPVAPAEPPVVVIPPTPVPAAIGDEQRDLKLLNGFVTARGQLIEFGRNGRLEALTKRLADDLAGYVGQPAHPALCNGAPQMLDFHTERMEPVQVRLTAIADLANRTRALAAARVAAALKQEPTATDARPLAVLVGEMSRLLLPTGATPAAASSDLQAQLRLLVEATRSMPWVTEPPETQVAAGLALRALEAAIYADLQQGRAAAVERWLFGALRGIRAAHKTHCTCAE
jgi:hypothetical protein